MHGTGKFRLAEPRESGCERKGRLSFLLRQRTDSLGLDCRSNLTGKENVLNLLSKLCEKAFLEKAGGSMLGIGEDPVLDGFHISSVSAAFTIYGKMFAG